MGRSWHKVTDPQLRMADDGISVSKVGSLKSVLMGNLLHASSSFLFSSVHGVCLLIVEPIQLLLLCGNVYQPAFPKKNTLMACAQNVHVLRSLSSYKIKEICGNLQLVLY